MSFQSDVHRCLKVPELFSAICHYSKDSSLLQLSLTCRYFCSDALDALWYKPEDGIRALLHCFPAGVIQKKRGDYCLRRTPREDEWSRVRHYADRIRVLRFDGYRSQATLKCYRLFLDHWPYSGQAMFPNLHGASLQSSVPIGSKICAAAARMRPLRNLEVFFEEPSSSIGSDLNKMKKCFATSRNTLRSLVLSATDLSDAQLTELADSIGNTICTFTALEKISFLDVPLSSKALAYLARLPTLTTLSFQYFSNYANPQYLSPGNNNFRHLKTLALIIDMSQMLGNACNMLTNMHPVFLEHLSITFYQLPLVPYLIRLVQAAARFTSLHSLALECEGEERWGSWMSHDPKNWPVPCSSILNALFPLRKLRSLSIKEFRLRITPVDIGSLTHLWPELQVLRFTADRQYTTVRIADLHLLGVGCSRLHTVDLPLLNDSPSTSSEAVPAYENRQIRRLNVALYSRGGASKWVREGHMEVLRRMFPEAEMDPCIPEEDLNRIRARGGVEEDSGSDGLEDDWDEEDAMEDLEYDDEY